MKETRVKMLPQKVKLPKTAMNIEINKLIFQTGNLILIIMIHQFNLINQCIEVSVRGKLGK